MGLNRDLTQLTCWFREYSEEQILHLRQGCFHVLLSTRTLFVDSAVLRVHTQIVFVQLVILLSDYDQTYSEYNPKRTYLAQQCHFVMQQR